MIQAYTSQPIFQCTIRCPLRSPVNFYHHGTVPAMNMLGTTCHFLPFHGICTSWICFSGDVLRIVAWDSSTLNHHMWEMFVVYFFQAIQQSQIQVVDSQVHRWSSFPPLGFCITFPLTALPVPPSHFVPCEFFNRTILALVEVHRWGSWLLHPPGTVVFCSCKMVT